MFGCYLLETCPFLMKQKGRGGEDLGGIGEEETIIRIYCLRKESIFRKQEK